MELEIQKLIPEIILLAAACVCTLMGLSRKQRVLEAIQTLAALACLAACVVAARDTYTHEAYFDAQATISHFNPNFITILACVIGFLSVLVAWDMPAKSDPAVTDGGQRGEFYGMMLFSLAGVAMIGKVNDLVWLFVALELVSIPTYIMVATGRGQIIAQEAGIKYFFLGALAAAIFLFGFSYLYGATGSTRFEDIHRWFSGAGGHPITPLAMVGFLMVLIGVGYKIAAFPMHFYTPDVYQGAATPVTAFLAFAPKTAGMISIISILGLMDFDFSSQSGQAIQNTLIVMAVATMSIGNVMALLQRNIKRIFAYSSIAHSGYMLVGLVAIAPFGSSAFGDPSTRFAGVSATVFYLASYAIMNLGAFAVLVHLQGKADAAEDLDDIAGLGKSHPGLAFIMALCLMSLIGMPLTVGFLGKYYLVSEALKTGHTTLAIIVMINAAVAAAYYLRIIGAMYLRESLYPFVMRKTETILVAGVVCAVGVIFFFVMPSSLLMLNKDKVEMAKPEETNGAAVVPAGALPVTAAK